MVCVNPVIGGILGIRLFAAKIRELREKKFGPRVVAAEKMGIPYRTLEDWEMGVKEPGSTSLGILARALGVTCDSLLELLLADDPIEPAANGNGTKKKLKRPPKRNRQQKPKGE